MTPAIKHFIATLEAGDSFPHEFWEIECTLYYNYWLFFCWHKRNIDHKPHHENA